MSVIQAYAGLIATITAFESWLPVVRFGVHSPQRLAFSISAGLALDAAASITAAALAILAVFLMGDWAGISEEHQGLAALFCLSLLTSLTGAPKGYFRLKERYDLLASNQIAQGIAVLAVSAVLAAAGASLTAYVISFAVLTGLYNLSPLYRLWRMREAENLQFLNVLGTRRRRVQARAFFAMAAGTSVLSSLISSRRHLALLMVSSSLGEASAGLYSAAARVSSVVSRFGAILNHVVLPEFVRSARTSNPATRRRTANRVTVYAAVAAGILAFGGVLLQDWLIVIAAGAQYAAGAPVFAWLFVAECVTLAGVHLSASVQAQMGARPMALIAATALLLYLPLAYSLAIHAGVNGVAAASCLAALATYAATLWLVRARLR